ncbi:zinc finger protein 501-like isoform X2 [Culicoides brevitarsis]|uniref:zinc finger protein 501-like isoform X2 n=1 Tax=Culicoides brevitarsis TaxID=469753 RepID=UPI00307CA7DE
MSCVLDVSALYHLRVKIPKYQAEPVVKPNSVENPSIRRFQCCEKLFSDLSSLCLHQMSHEKEKTPFEKFLENENKREGRQKSKLECNFCGKLLSCEAARKVHERTQHKEGGHTCKYCGKFFGIKVNGLTHEKRMHRMEESLITPFKCEICEQGFTKEFNFDQHMKRHKNGEIDDLNSEQTCETCQKSYKSKRDLNRHIRRMHQSSLWTSYTCQYCGKFFSRKADGQVHERKVHRQLVESSKEFKCQFCIRGFDTEKYLQLHEDNHKNGELTCKTCGKEFYYQAQCKTHENYCGEEEEKYICHYCSKEFARKGALLPHFASHFDIFKFSCEQCGKSFKRKEALKRHLVALHSEIKKTQTIQCEICAKILSSTAALKRHMKQTHDAGTKIVSDEYEQVEILHENEEKREFFVVEEQDVAQTIEVYSFMIY